MHEFKYDQTMETDSGTIDLEFDSHIESHYSNDNSDMASPTFISNVREDGTGWTLFDLSG